MKLLSTLIFILFATITTFFCLSHASEAGGKCNGSASCTICTNCSRCQYCKGGGSCGACSTTTQKQSTARGTSNAHSTNGSSHTITSKTKKESNHYFVEPLSLNIWKTPSAGSEVLCTLKEFDSVTLLKMYDLKWAQVEVICNNGDTVTGYVLKKALIKIEE